MRDYQMSLLILTLISGVNVRHMCTDTLSVTALFS